MQTTLNLYMDLESLRRLSQSHENIETAQSTSNFLDTFEKKGLGQQTGLAGKFFDKKGYMLSFDLRGDSLEEPKILGGVVVNNVVQPDVDGEQIFSGVFNVRITLDSLGKDYSRNDNRKFLQSLSQILLDRKVAPPIPDSLSSKEKDMEKRRQMLDGEIPFRCAIPLWSFQTRESTFQGAYMELKEAEKANTMIGKAMDKVEVFLREMANASEQTETSLKP